jgi:hypothetical protein
MRKQAVALFRKPGKAQRTLQMAINSEEARKNAHVPPLFKTRQAGIADQMEGIDEVDEEVKAVSSYALLDARAGRQYVAAVGLPLSGAGPMRARRQVP